MGFEEELRNHLRRLEDGPVLQRPRSIAIEKLHHHFLGRLREHQDQRPDWVEQIHREWAFRFGDFAEYLADFVPSDAADVDTETLEHACRVLDAALGCLDSGIPLVDRLEYEHLAAAFPHASREVATYALENRLTRLESNALALTSLGRIFLRLRGRDALRWLLTVEVLQSQGNHDQWRVARGLLQQLFETGIHFAVEHSPPFVVALDRLAELGVTSAWHGEPALDNRAHAVLTEDMRELVSHVLEVGPWHAAVAALLEDERASLFQPATTKATEATVEQTRMIAHEVRNALGPARYNIDELVSDGLEPQHRSRIEAIQKGVLRVMEFVDQMVATSELITEPATTFELDGLLREALGWLDGSEAVQLDLPALPLRLRAPRSRFLRALLDVVRNALHSVTPPPPVRITARRDDREVRIMVDDGGPGIPPELRTRVFDDGFTTRPGGSGFGLAFLRQVVERELRGRVSCEDGDLGGARFTISIPDPEPEQ